MLVSLIEPGLHLGYRRGELHCLRGSTVVRVLPLHHVDALHLHGTVSLSNGARRCLLREGVDVVFLDAAGRYLGRLVGNERPGGERRLEQYRTCLDGGRSLALARQIVLGKLRNQRTFLMARRVGADSEGVRGLDAARGAAEGAADVDALRGAEGLGARAYFGAFAAAVQPEEMAMHGRSRRPPRDPVNAMLSYGYTLLVARVEHAVRASAADPYLGVLHAPGRGAPSLALDLAEEWRPLVDRVVLRLVNRREVGLDDFRTPLEQEVDDPGAVWMDRTARTILIRAWERALDGKVTHPVTGESWPARRAIRLQARQMVSAMAMRDPVYRPVELGGR